MARFFLGGYVAAVGLLAFSGVYQGSTYVEDMWWGIGRWLMGIAAVLTLPAGIVILPPVLYLIEALGWTSLSDSVDALVVAAAAVLAASVNGILLTFAARKLASWRRSRGKGHR